MINTKTFKTIKYYMYIYQFQTDACSGQYPHFVGLYGRKGEIGPSRRRDGRRRLHDGALYRISALRSGQYVLPLPRSFLPRSGPHVSDALLYAFSCRVLYDRTTFKVVCASGAACTPGHPEADFAARCRKHFRPVSDRVMPWRWAPPSRNASWLPASASGWRTRPTPTSRTAPWRRRFRRAWAVSPAIWV